MNFVLGLVNKLLIIRYTELNKKGGAVEERRGSAKLAIAGDPQNEGASRLRLQKLLQDQKQRSRLSLRELAAESKLSLSVVANLLSDQRSQLSLVKLLPLLELLGLGHATVKDLIQVASGEVSPASLLARLEERDTGLTMQKVSRNGPDGGAKNPNTIALLELLHGSLATEFEKTIRETVTALQREAAEMENLRDASGATVAADEVLGSASRAAGEKGTGRGATDDSRRQYIVKMLRESAPSRQAHDELMKRFYLNDRQLHSVRQSFPEWDHVRFSKFTTQSTETSADDKERPYLEFSFDSVMKIRTSQVPRYRSMLLMLATLSVVSPRRYHLYFDGGTHSDVFRELEALEELLARAEETLLRFGPKESFSELWTAKRHENCLHGVGPAMLSEYIYFMGHGRGQGQLLPVPVSAKTEKMLHLMGLYVDSPLTTENYAECLRIINSLAQESGVEPDLLEGALHEIRWKGYNSY